MTGSNVRQLRPVAAVPDAPPTFTVTSDAAHLPPGEYLIKALDGRVTLAWRPDGGATWGPPVTAVRS